MFISELKSICVLCASFVLTALNDMWKALHVALQNADYSTLIFLKYICFGVKCMVYVICLLFRHLYTIYSAMFNCLFNM